MKRIAVLALGLAACGETTQKPAVAKPPPPELVQVEAVRWLPAEDGVVYAYETRDLVTGAKGVLTLRARRVSPTLVDLVGPRHTEHLEYRADGIMRVTEGTFLVKTPLAQGTTWTGGPNASFAVGRVGASVKVPAGDFDRCAEIVESRGGAIRGTVTTTFCADVGIVRMETQGVAEGGKTTVHETLELTSYGKAVDIGAPGLTKTEVKPR